MSIADVTEHSLEQLVSLHGRVAVITGGAKGIGCGIARRLAEAGADVLLADLDVSAADHVVQELVESFGVRALAREVDVAEPSHVVALAQAATGELGHLDIWVNNAGIYPTTRLLEMSDKDWQRVIDVNLTGAFLGAREAASQMKEQGRGGVILNISSTAGFGAAGPGLAHYVSSKHGLVGLTKSLAIELAPLGIRVLGIAPTLIETPGIEANREMFRKAGLGDVIRNLAESLPLGRSGVPDDVARVALFCASDLSMFMTGSTLLVDAGDIAR